MQDLPQPEVLRCYFADSFQPPLPAMVLQWDADAPGVADSVWYLPDGVSLRGPAPTRLGITIYREDEDAYHVRLLWDGVGLSWERLRRTTIMASSLAPVLAALGTDLWYILNQPVSDSVHAQAA